MKQIFLKVYPNGKTTTNASVLNFDRENKSGEIVIDYSEVDFLDWDKQLDLIFSDGTTAFVTGSGNTLTVPLLESYLKKGSMTVQPVAKRLVGSEVEKAKWQVVALSVRDSLNVLENDVTVTISIAEQMQAEIDEFKHAEALRVLSEIDRENAETLRLSNESSRETNESTRQLNESVRVDNEASRISAEANRVVVEQDRVSAESGRVIAEQGRASAESSRVVAETNRANAENVRVSSEATRASAESTRISNENTRVSQESARNVWEEYNALTTYVVGNKVSYLGSSYRCILESTGNLPTNTTYWLLIAQKGDNTNADAVTYDNSGSTLDSTNLQDAIDELDSEKAGKLFATNLVTNGDFSNGTTGWSFINAGTPNVVAGVLSFTPNASPFSSSSQQHVYQTERLALNNKYYARADLYGSLTVGLFVTTYKFGNVSLVNTWQTISGIYHSGVTGDRAFGVRDTASSDWVETKVRNVFFIDLTATFGAGKEPTKEQMDWLLAQKFTNSWFDGTAELTSITDLLTLVNTKADKTQEAWITPTLTNSWVGDGAVPIGYMKDGMGFVHLTGRIQNGVSAQPAFQTPIGYTPAYTTRFVCPTRAGGVFFTVDVNTNGQIFVYRDGTADRWVDLTQISFKAK